MTVFSIAAGIPFDEAMAAQLLDEAGGDPLRLAAMTVIVPTNRARRAFRNAFLRCSGGRPLVLPRLLAVGEMDEDEALFAGFRGEAEAALETLPPAMPTLTRQVLLSQLILAKGGNTVDQAARLAAELARLLDIVQAEELSFDRLATLVPEQYAHHWQLTLQFLEIVTQAWPGVLAAHGCVDAATRQARLLRTQADLWRQIPPAGPVIIAGVNGSQPAVRALLVAVAGLPQGRVVLAGLDNHLDEVAWAAVDASHPQFALKQLLAALEVPRAAVAEWPSPVGRRSPLEREHLISSVLRPASQSERWQALGPLAREAVEGITRLDCPNPREEALAIALVMREALEIDDRTAALVTPDRDLARRVSGELRRWGIAADDSAGRPLMVTPPGAFLRLTLAMVADDFAPVALLAVLKHPLAGLGMAVGRLREAARQLERLALRGVRPAPGVAGLRAALAASRQGERVEAEVWDMLDRLESRTADLVAALARGPQPLADVLECHLQAAEALADSDELAGPLRLWASDAGEAAADFARALSEAAEWLPSIDPAGYAALFDTLMVGRMVRPEFGSHPRLAIWGPLEARLQHADVMIIASLNEDRWPAPPANDPWMSRPMRAAFGLPSLESKIGLTAHDFAGLMGSPRVILTRALKQDGTPTVPSRWLLRLDAVLKAGGQTLHNAQSPWSSWAARWDDPASVTPVGRPNPTPPLSARPNQLSVSDVELWRRDPYGLYAKKILRLKALDPLEAEPGMADYGILVHRALENFRRAYPGPLPPDALGLLIAMGDTAFADLAERPSVQAFWRPRFARIAAWVIEHERARLANVQQSFLEIRGTRHWDGFTLSAKADRLDVLADGTLAIIDYKTGSLPTAADITAGYAGQLPLEAAIAEAGGFVGVGGRETSQLLYWHLHGKADGGGLEKALPEPWILQKQAVSGLLALVAAYQDPAVGYPSQPSAKAAPRYSDYQHLARVKEWASFGGEEGDGDGEEGGDDD